MLSANVDSGSPALSDYVKVPVGFDRFPAAIGASDECLIRTSEPRIKTDAGNRLSVVCNLQPEVWLTIRATAHSQ